MPRRKKQKRKENRQRSGSLPGRCLGSILMAAALVAALLLLFALALQWEWLGEESIPVVTILLKSLGAAVAGCMASAKAAKARPVLSGLCGTGFVVFSFALCSLMEKIWSVSAALLADAALGFLCAAVVRLAADLLHRRERQKNT